MPINRCGPEKNADSFLEKGGDPGTGGGATGGEGKKKRLGLGRTSWSPRRGGREKGASPAYK